MIQQRTGALAPGIDHDIGDFTVKRIALHIQGLQLFQRIDVLQQGTRFVVPGAMPQIARLAVQIHHQAAFGEMPAVIRVEYRAAAGGEHHVGELGQLIDHLFLARAKPGLALDLEYEGDAHAGAVFDFMIGVVKGLAQLGGEMPAHGGLSRPHQPDQKYVVRDFHAFILAARPGR